MSKPTTTRRPHLVSGHWRRISAKRLEGVHPAHPLVRVLGHRDARPVVRDASSISAPILTRVLETHPLVVCQDGARLFVIGNLAAYQLLCQAIRKDLVPNKVSLRVLVVDATEDTILEWAEVDVVAGMGVLAHENPARGLIRALELFQTLRPNQSWLTTLSISRLAKLSATSRSKIYRVLTKRNVNLEEESPEHQEALLFDHHTEALLETHRDRRPEPNDKPPRIRRRRRRRH